MHSVLDLWSSQFSVVLPEAIRTESLGEPQ